MSVKSQNLCGKENVFSNVVEVQTDDSKTPRVIASEDLCRPGLCEANLLVQVRKEDAGLIARLVWVGL